jgi:hypothetical protein
LATKPQSVTSVGVSPEEERRGRVIKYTVAMTVRVICLIVAVVYPGSILMWIGFAGAILLPYFAVVIANATGAGASKKTNNAQTVAAPTLRISADAFVNASRPTAADSAEGDFAPDEDRG